MTQGWPIIGLRAIGFWEISAGWNIEPVQGMSDGRSHPLVDLHSIQFITGVRRIRLIWFAAGAACASLAVVGIDLVVSSPAEEQGWFLVIAEQGQSLQDGRASALWQGAEIARDCGTRSFEMMPGLAADAADRTRIPLVRENNPAMDCVIERAKEAGLWVGVGLEPLRAAD